MAAEQAAFSRARNLAAAIRTERLPTPLREEARSLSGKGDRLSSPLDEHRDDYALARRAPGAVPLRTDGVGRVRSKATVGLRGTAPLLARTTRGESCVSARRTEPRTSNRGEVVQGRPAKSQNSGNTGAKRHHCPHSSCAARPHGGQLGGQEPELRPLAVLDGPTSATDRSRLPPPWLMASRVLVPAGRFMGRIPRRQLRARGFEVARRRGVTLRPCFLREHRQRRLISLDRGSQVLLTVSRRQLRVGVPEACSTSRGIHAARWAAARRLSVSPRTRARAQ